MHSSRLFLSLAGSVLLQDINDRENMDKESIIELQKIDCNCNDCIFMERDQNRFKQSLSDHHRWQLNYFNVCKENLLIKADEWQDENNPKYDYQKGEQVRIQANALKFQFDKKKVTINYGHCYEFKKPVTFISNVCQLHTQECFKHRRA